MVLATQGKNSTPLEEAGIVFIECKDILMGDERLNNREGVFQNGRREFTPLLSLRWHVLCV